MYVFRPNWIKSIKLTIKASISSRKFNQSLRVSFGAAFDEVSDVHSTDHECSEHQPDRVGKHRELEQPCGDFDSAQSPSESETDGSNDQLQRDALVWNLVEVLSEQGVVTNNLNQ